MNLLSISYSKTSIRTQAGPAQPVSRKTETNYGIEFGASGNIPINLGFRLIFPKG